MMKTLIVFLALAATAWPQAAGEVNARYTTKEGRAQVAAGLAAPTRDKTQKPEAVAAALHLKPGMTVADVGTGVGYMLPYLSKAVGPSGKVLGEDVQTDFLDQAMAKVATEKLSNVSLILGGFTDPKLPAGAVDVELVLDVYHHFDEPAKMITALAPALKSGGHLVIVEYHKASSPQPGHIKREWSEVVKEVESNGFRLLSKIDRITDTQYLLTFGKK
jgi:ubiquinone/menaquinone biosynthesis C-methylase UbiE